MSTHTHPHLGISLVTLSGALFLFLLFSLIAGWGILLPLAIAGVIITVFLFLRSPLILLFFLIIVRMSLDYSAQYFSIPIFGTTLSLSQFLGVAIATVGFFLILQKRRLLPSFPLLTPFLILFLWGTFSLLYSISGYTTLYELIRFFDLFVMGFFAWVVVKTERDFQLLLKAIFFSSLLPIAFGLFQFAFSIGLEDENVSIPRIFGTFSHPNVFSLYLMTVIALALMSFMTWAHSKKERFFLILLLALLTGTLLLTFARIAWIALFIFLFCIALYRYRVLLIPLFLFPLVLYTFSGSIQERVAEALHPTPDSSIVWRQNLWHDVLLKAKYDHTTIIGTGMDTFRIVSEDLRGKRFGSNEPHNDFVKFYIEGGIVGLGLFIAYLTSFFIVLFHAYRHAGRVENIRTSLALMSFLLIALIVASFSDNVFKNTPVQWLIWITLGGLLALAQKKNT